MSPWLVALVIIGATIWGLIVAMLVLFLYVCRIADTEDDNA